MNLDKSYKLFIDGKWIDSKDKKTIETFNPATGEKLADIVEATLDDVNLAVSSARKAFNEWRKTTPVQRAEILEKIANIIDENKEWLAKVETMNNGKPIRETMNVDVPLSSDHFRYFASVIRTDEGNANILDGNKLNIILKEPIGVVGQIIPWNFPFLMAAWKLAPALAAGCTVVIKPSGATSLSLLELVKLIQHLLPNGVLNVITGSGSKSGEYLKNHEGIDKLAFTGSTEVGRAIAESAAKRLIPATLELGGKSANIIFDDVDFDKAIDGVQLGILFNQGQVCCAGSRVFVQERIYDKFIDQIAKRFKDIKVGNPLDENTQMGSQISEGHLNKILKYIEIGKKEGAKVLVGGNRITTNGLDKGAFLEPTLLVDVKNDMCVAQEEIFGPVAVIIRFKDEDELIKMVNDSIYGLGGGIFTTNITRALNIANKMETGRVWINTYNQIPSGSPFGGYKQSGIGRETHKSTLDNYCQTKNIMIDLTGQPSGFYKVK